MQDVKQTDGVAGHEIAGHENTGHENARRENAGHETNGRARTIRTMNANNSIFFKNFDRNGLQSLYSLHMYPSLISK